jgi:hypothetical protein
MSRRDPPSIGKREAGARRQRIGRTARSLGLAQTIEGVIMIGRKKLSNVRREVAELLERLPKEPSGTWIEREIHEAEGKPNGMRRR